MKLKIEFEIPNWTRWIAVGLVGGLAIGYGIATVRAAPVAVSTWNSGDVLTAAALNQNFQMLQDAINAQQVAIDALTSPECPTGYLRDQSTMSIVLCKRGADEVVRVGTGGAAFWIDRYEASLWDNLAGNGTQWGLLGEADFPPGFLQNGQYATAVFALSVAGVKPSAAMTWYQAQAACRLSGKRLATGEEWLAGGSGTLDPGANDGATGNCTTNASDRRITGTGTDCASRWGAQDMIGSLWEWTADWQMSPGDAFGQWPETPYNSDALWGIASGAGASPGEGPVPGLPSTILRGGTYGLGELGGLFSMSLGSSAAYRDPFIGVRCVVPR